jgi:integrase
MNHAARAFSPCAGNVLKRYVRPACVKLGIRFSGFHDCRHSAVTRLLNIGTSPQTVARIAGHSDVRVTLNTYAHVKPEQMEAPLAQLSGSLFVPSPKEAE